MTSEEMNENTTELSLFEKSQNMYEKLYNEKISKICGKFNIPTPDKEKPTLFDQVCFCLKHNIKDTDDFYRIFGNNDNNSQEGSYVSNLYYSGQLDKPGYWFIKFSPTDIKKLEEVSPEFSSDFYRGKPFYFEWLLHNKMYSEAIDEVRKYGWTIITENALCSLLEETTDINQLFMNYGFFVYFVNQVDTSSDEYKNMEEKPFVSRDFYKRDSYSWRGKNVIKTASTTLPHDMFFSLLDNLNFKGDSELYVNLIKKKLPFPTIFSSLERLRKHGIELSNNIYCSVLSNYNENEAFEMIKWGVKNWKLEGFFTLYNHFKNRLFEETVPGGDILWIDYLWDKQFTRWPIFFQKVLVIQLFMIGCMKKAS